MFLGIKLLLNNLCLNKTLLSINISGNQIDASLSEDFANFLRKNQSLGSLNVGDNQLRAAGMFFFPLSFFSFLSFFFLSFFFLQNDLILLFEFRSCYAIFILIW
jgi:hypothetical protein